MTRKTWLFLRDVWSLAKPYWFSEDRWAGRGLLLVIVALNLGQVYLSVVMNHWYNDFYNALQNLDEAAFYHQMLRFCVIAAIFIAVFIYRFYLGQVLQLRWRRWLTHRYIDAWLGDRAYYLMQLRRDAADNPDQRIADDIRMFIDQTLTLGISFMRETVSLVSFGIILWNLSGNQGFGLFGVEIPGYMLWAAFLYAVLGTWLTHLVGRPLVRLNFEQQRFEADFRYSLVRFRENTEGVALYGGERDETRVFHRRFGNVVANWWALMKRYKHMYLLTSTYGQAAVVFPFLVAAPRFFAKEIQLGDVMQIASAFGQVQSSLSWFIDAYASLTEWRATVDRLTGFRDAIARAHAGRAAEGPVVAQGAQDRLALDHLDVKLPDGTLLLKDVDETVRKGERVLVTGPSGSGKSTLFRAIAGIWPFGTGRVEVPGASVLFLPQKPYIPIGTLREVVCYPAAAARVPDEDVREALAAVQLGHLAGRLDEEGRWAMELSPGEQQRLAFARALLAKPDWLFLDEATASLDAPTEDAMYRLLRQRLPGTTVVSIGHRPSLAALHERHLEVRPAPGGGRLVRREAPAG